MTKKMQLLWAEDEEIIRTIIELAFENQPDFALQLHASGEELAVAAQTTPADVVVLDVVMPKMDGPAVLQALGEMPHTRSIPVIFATGESDAGRIRKLLDLGAIGIISKPINTVTLPGQIRDILAQADTACDTSAIVSADQEHASELAQLQKQYLESIMERVEDIRKSSVQFFSRVDRTQALTAIRYQAHTMAGSAKTFGYAAIGDAARELEHAIMAMLPLSDEQHTDQSLFLEKLARFFGQVKELRKTASAS